MRKTILLLCGLFACLALSAASILENDDNLQKVELDKKKGKDNSGDAPRNLTYLEVYYDDSSNLAEVHHDCLGLCDIYILDSCGNPVDHSTMMSQSYSVEPIMLPSVPDTYTIIIDSEAVYAYGYIVVQ